MRTDGRANERGPAGRAVLDVARIAGAALAALAVDLYLYQRQAPHGRSRGCAGRTVIGRSLGIERLAALARVITSSSTGLRECLGQAGRSVRAPGVPSPNSAMLGTVELLERRRTGETRCSPGT